MISMDDIDRAQEYDLLYQGDALIRHRLGRGPVPVTRQNQSEPRFCLDCGEEIPAARLEINPRAIRCVACQTSAETHRSAASG